MQEFEADALRPSFPRHLDALIVEDVEGDARLIVKALTRGGFSVSFERVESRAQMIEALERKRWDVVISDCALPKFSATRALEVLHERKMDGLPVIVVSGVLREDAAEELFKAGAHDFLSKSSLGRLAPAVERELEFRSLSDRHRRELQKALAETQAVRDQLDSVLDCAPAIIIALDLNGTIKFVNRLLTSRRKEDVIGADWLSFVPPADREKARTYLHNVMRTGAPASFELCANTSDGRRLWHSCFMGPMRSQDRVVGAVIIAQEVTEARRVREELTAAQRLAAVGTLAAGVAHEINTPMQFVSDSLHFLRDATRDVMNVMDKHKRVQHAWQRGAGAAELASANAELEAAELEADLEYLTEQIPKAFDRCIDGLQRMTTIVRSLKEFAHPAQEQASAVDLNRAIQSTLTIARNEYKYVAELETDLGDLPSVVCHVNDITQVVLNLVVNAAHAIADKHKNGEVMGTIRVSTRCEDDTVVIAVSDTGSGIPEAVRDRIFEPFFTTKEVGRGTGQGLALAWSIVTEKHAGQLTFETEVDKGTTFFIRLPIAGP